MIVYVGIKSIDFLGFDGILCQNGNVYKRRRLETSGK